MKGSLNKHQIKEVRSEGKKLDCRFFTGYFKQAEEGGIAIVTSARIGSSVQRNRIKRRLRQALRLILKNKGKEEQGQIKALLYAKNASIKAKSEDLAHSMKTALGMI